MSDSKIDPKYVTSPFQLLASLLIVLVLIDGGVLSTAILLPQGILQYCIILASIGNVFIFLGAIFLLQTTFRTHLLGDKLFSEYVSKKTNETVLIDKRSIDYERLESIKTTDAATAQPLVTANDEWARWRVGINTCFLNTKMFVGDSRQQKSTYLSHSVLSTDPLLINGPLQLTIVSRLIGK